MNANLGFLKLSSSLLFFLFSCAQTSNNQPKTSKTNIPDIDTSKYAILKFHTTDTWLSKNGKSTSLTNDEIEEIEIILGQCIDSYNPDQILQFDTISKVHPEYNLKVADFIIDLSRYKRQYLPFINCAGQKEVWVNCFCSDFADWRNEVLMVSDGGNCYFNLIINLATKIFSIFIVNEEV
jgi:hypothetical protein